ncbi:hypothetical protein LCGC14_0310450 [marine sediment metagenome]|uniref:Uncharacterized protein n=1 Tax=marine sediment metagenome TaxID=412755 RepID=A0A0F9U4K7_9ZZZZ
MMNEDKTKPYEVDIGGERVVIDPSQKEAILETYEVDSGLEEDNSPHPRDEDTMADEDAAAAMHPARTTPLYKGVKPLGTEILCKNDRCNNLVGESLNPGVLKQFCHRTCAHNYHNRLYEHRQNASGGWLVERHRVTAAELHFVRTMPSSLAMAERRYKAHITKRTCTRAEPDGKCPSHDQEDYYSSKRLCLVYAVLVDDLYDELAKSRGEVYLRRWTSEDGRWAEKSDLPHLEYTKGGSQDETNLASS